MMSCHPSFSFLSFLMLHFPFSRLSPFTPSLSYHFLGLSSSYHPQILSLNSPCHPLSCPVWLNIACYHVAALSTYNQCSIHQRECCRVVKFVILNSAPIHSTPRVNSICGQRPFAVTGSVPCLFTAIKWSDATYHTHTRYGHASLHSKNEETAQWLLCLNASYAHGCSNSNRTVLVLGVLKS